MRWKSSIVIAGMLLSLATTGMSNAERLPPTQRVTASFSVTTFNDEYNQNGECSLREAIVAANTNSISADCGDGAQVDTINLASGTYQMGIDNPISAETRLHLDDDSGLYGDFDITEPVSLVGAAPNLTMISGAGLATTNRILHVQNGLVNLRNLSLIEANSPWNGAAILNQGQLTLNNVNLRNNHTQLNIGYNNVDSLHGGAIYNSGDLSVNNSAFIDNKAGDGLANFNGGAIYNINNLTIDTVVFLQNKAVHGGAVYSITNDHDLTIVNSQFIDNEALLLENKRSNPQGGALWLDSPTTINNTILRGNKAAAGGAIYTLKSLVLTMSIFKNNTASNSNGLAYGTAIQNQGSATINRSIFQFNAGDAAALGNAGSMWLDSTTIIDNTNRAIELMGTAPVGTGGGIYNTNQLIAVNSTIGNNTTNFAGAGIYNSRSLHLINTSVISNAIKFGDEQGAGGGVYSAPTSTSYLTNTLVSLNTAPAGADCWGITQGFYALISNRSYCQLAGTTNLAAQPAQTGPLTKMDDHTWVVPLTQASPAIDAGSSQLCLAIDQRSQLRPMDGNGDLLARCDIGAYEFIATRTFYHQFAPWASR